LISAAGLTRAARWIGAGVLAVLVSLFTPIPNGLARWLEPAAQIEPADAIVVLGGDVSPDGTLAPSSLVRLVQGVLLYRRHLAPLIVLSGTPPEVITRARLASDLGVPPTAALEIRADTTRAEATAVARLLAPREARRILLVTDAQHLVRARLLFERAGFDVLPAPAGLEASSAHSPEARLLLLREVLQEVTARLYYRLAGYL
jgi:uncharacterized SAM-binding protein YcdF (DUF218 family)